MTEQRGLVAELKERWPILEMVKHLGLEEGRKGTKILCPFHADTEPSCHLYVDQDRFQCFACEEGGDQLDLAAGRMQLPLAQAIASLAAEAGLDWRQREWADAKPRPPSPAEMLLRVAAKSHLEVLRTLHRDYPSTRHKEAWCSLVEAAFWHYDEILRRYRNRELQPDTALELLLIWWRWMTGRQAKPTEMVTLFSVIGDDRFWKAISKELGHGEQTASTGDRGRGAGGTAVPPTGVADDVAAPSGQERPRGRRGLAPHAGQDRDQREGQRAPEHGGRAGPTRRSLGPRP